MVLSVNCMQWSVVSGQWQGFGVRQVWLLRDSPAGAGRGSQRLYFGCEIPLAAWQRHEQYLVGSLGIAGVVNNMHETVCMTHYD